MCLICTSYGRISHPFDVIQIATTHTYAREIAAELWLIAATVRQYIFSSPAQKQLSIVVNMDSFDIDRTISIKYNHSRLMILSKIVVFPSSKIPCTT